MAKIIVQNTEITVLQQDEKDYISLQVWQMQEEEKVVLLMS